MNEISSSGLNRGYSSRPFYSTDEIAAKDAQETASFAAQKAKEEYYRQAQESGVKVTLSEEAIARVLSGTDVAASESGDIFAVAAQRNQATTLTLGSNINLAHPLFSDGRTETQITDFRTFFTSQTDRSPEATADLQDALYDAVRHASAKTDSTDAVEIGLIREKLNVLNAKYVDEAHQTDAAMEIDKYINRLVESRDNLTRSMVEADLKIGNVLKDEGRIKEAQQRLDDLANGNDRTQTEMRQVFDITTGSASAAEASERLTSWYNQLAHRTDSQDTQFSDLLAGWQQFLNQYGS